MVGYHGKLLGRILSLDLINQAVLAKYEDDLEKGYQMSRSCKRKLTYKRLSLFEVSAGPVRVLSDVHAKDRKQLEAGNIHLSHF